jgi:multiple sugar transport system substrate-binding protein
LKRCCFFLLVLVLARHLAFAAPILFLSTQLSPLPEAEKMREIILRDFPQQVDFEPYDRTAFDAQVVAAAAESGGAVVLGGLREDFVRLHQLDVLASVEGILPRLSNRVFLPGTAAPERARTQAAYFVPWMQATYLMAANRRALPFLPKGAELNKLSYDELLQWARNIQRSTGKGRLGFPAGPNGLMMRFLEGYLYPSFTGSMAEDFSGPLAVSMWQYLRELWPYVAPPSLISSRMDSALLNGEVWIAWDHTARLLQAFKEQPDAFVAFPAPAGPKGRGFISVVAGLGVLRRSSSPDAEGLVEYLTRPIVQVETMESVGFLPVVDIAAAQGASPGMLALFRAAVDQAAAPDAIVGGVPVRSASAARQFDLAYLVAFSRIVLRSMDIPEVLARQGAMVTAAETGAPAGSTP